VNKNGRSAPWKVLLLGFGLIIYGGFSSSTPDSLGGPEMLIGAILVFVSGIRQAIVVAGGALVSDRPVLPHHVYVSFLWLAVVPSLVGILVFQNDLRSFARDGLSLIYLYLPVFLLPAIARNPGAARTAVVAGLCTVGLLFSVRHFAAAGDEAGEIGRQTIFGSMEYFASDPAVLFAATYLFVSSIMRISRGAVFPGMVLLLLSAIPWAALIAVVVRAQMALVVAAALIQFGLVLRSRRLSIFGVAFLIAGIVTTVGQPGVGDIIAGAWELAKTKTLEVGASGRVEESLAAIDATTASNTGLLLGKGWGGIFSSPVAGEGVRFVHNFFVYMFMKGGLLSLPFVFLYLLWIIKANVRLVTTAFANPEVWPLCAAVSNVLIVNLFLEAGFKSLSFGVVLLIMASEAITGQGAIVKCGVRRVDQGATLLPS
jgi:hypothetical protein